MHGRVLLRGEFFNGVNFKNLVSSDCGGMEVRDLSSPLDEIIKRAGLTVDDKIILLRFSE
jgi:hypothetical protein